MHMEDGRIDLEDLRETIRIHRDVPPIIFANVGTTMKGATDDIAGIRQIFDDLAIPSHYIHADAALPTSLLLAAFLITFLITRSITRLIRAGRGPFKNNVRGGVHIQRAADERQRQAEEDDEWC